MKTPSDKTWPSHANPSRFAWTRPIEHGLWFGLLAGLLEGAIVNSLRGVPGLAVRCSEEILWQAPLFNTLFYALVGVLFALPAKLVRKQAVISMALAVLVAMLCFNMELIWGRMYQWAAILLGLGVGVQVVRWTTPRDEAFRRFQGRSLGVLLAVALLVGVSASNWAAGNERRAWQQLPPPLPGSPNVLLITLDTLRADHVSSLGSPRQTTPALDQFAQRGVLFESAIANSSWTLPSHAALLTGRSLAQHGADWLDPMSADVVTLGEALSKRGYATAAIAANREYVAPEWGLGRGFARFQIYGGAVMENLYRTIYGRKFCKVVLPMFHYFDIPGRKRAPQLNHEFLAWLDSVHDRPFFALLNYFDAHDPYIPPPGHVRKFDGPAPTGDVINFQTQGRQFRRKSHPSEADIQAEINGYDECVAYLDQHVGALLAELDRRKLLNNTLVIITSDHGEAFGNHDLFGHGNSLYVETLHVPLIVCWPGKIPAGQRVSSVVGLDRLPATIMALLGFEKHDFAGAPLFPSSTSSAPSADAGDFSSAVMSEATHAKRGRAGYPTAKGNLRSLVTDRWHCIVSDAGSVQLFDWRADPTEQNDLGASPEGKDVLATIRAELDRRPAGKAKRVTSGEISPVEERLGLAAHAP
ncbi:MAG: sulfatase [Phycisphaerae bacterium]